jgi:UDP-N-acetylmuramoylalanine--D-glutamate ligase
VVVDEDHGALLDLDRALVRGRLRALLQVLPPVPRAQLKTLVYGLARSGLSATERLRERGDAVVQVDKSLGNEDDLSLLDGAELLVKSPGVPGEAPLVVEARGRGIPVWSEVELGARLLEGARIVGVTGTNGKTTTVELLGAIFRAAGRDVAVAGNVGTPLTSIRHADWVVCELSSFQLEDVHELTCDIAVLLNLEPDHLDRHGSFEAYRDAKLRIFERARVRIVPRELGLEGIGFSADDELPAEPLIRGRHNRENAAAATAAAREAGIADAAIAEALRTFAGVPHRLELVGERDGVRFVNDSKATNVAAARRALAAYADEPVHLILGGSYKGEDFGPLAAAIGSNVRSVHLIGEEAPRLAEVIDGHLDGTLERAVAHALELAAAGDVVLLSPAAASYDQFDNFEARGDAFRNLVREKRSKPG